MSDPRRIDEFLADCFRRFKPVAFDVVEAAFPSRHLPPASRDAVVRDEPPANPTIPEWFRWAKLDTSELRQRVARAQAIPEGEAALGAHGLLIAGPSGSGKTSLACALLRAWGARNPGRQGIFASARSLGVARAQHALGAGEAPEVVRACSADLLVLDDLGSERDTPTNAVPDVIFTRAEAGRPMWVTTWMTPQAIAQRYGDGVARRLYEAGLVTIVACGKKDS